MLSTPLQPPPMSAPSPRQQMLSTPKNKKPSPLTRSNSNKPDANTPSSAKYIKPAGNGGGGGGTRPTTSRIAATYVASPSALSPLRRSAINSRDHGGMISKTPRANSTPIRTVGCNGSKLMRSLKKKIPGAALPSLTPTKVSPSVPRGVLSTSEVLSRDWSGLGNLPKRTKKIKNHYDRFIPDRSAMCISSSRLNIARREPGSETYMNAHDLAYQEEVARACGLALDKRILAFKAEPPVSKEFHNPSFPRPNRSAPIPAVLRRRILQSPERVLDAPGLVDDYYLNLLDWSCKNLVAVGLDRSVYLWNAASGEVNTLCTASPSDQISSLSWAADGTFLAVGTAEGDTQIWDTDANAKVRSMRGHRARVGVLAWDKHILSSGCRDGSIHNHDVRVAQHRVAELVAHTAEVCGLTWRADGSQLASGGNDNLVNIWDARSSTPKHTKTDHIAAVKALAWCPWQANLLASGGGTHDKHIHFWNTTTSSRVNSIDTGSQVTALIWSKEHREILSTHGYPNNNINIWSYPSLAKIADIPAHDARVLHTALSPDGSTVATTASDENLKFWKVFDPASKKGKSATGRSSSRPASAGGRDEDRASARMIR